MSNTKSLWLVSSAVLAVFFFMIFAGLWVLQHKQPVSVSPAPLFLATVEFYKSKQQYVMSDERFFLQDAEAVLDPTQPSTVLVFRRGVSWRTFLSSLPWHISVELRALSQLDAPQLRFYLHGTEVSGLLDKPIAEGDVVRVEIGE